MLELPYDERCAIYIKRKQRWINGIKRKRFEMLVGKRFQSHIYPLPFKPYVYSLLLSKGVDLPDETLWYSAMMTWDEFSDTQSHSVLLDNGKVYHTASGKTHGL